MSDPIMRAQHCPDSLLPASAKTLVKLARDAGWQANATVAIGPPDDADLAVMSVYVWCHKEGIRVHASWECPSDRSKPFGFRSAWKSPGVLGWPDQLNFTEVKSALTSGTV